MELLDLRAIPYSQAIPFLGRYPKYLKAVSQIDICAPMFLEELLTTAKMWKPPKCPSTDERTRQMWYTRTMKYYSASKRKEILTYAKIWMSLEDIMFSEISQSPKDTY